MLDDQGQHRQPVERQDRRRRRREIDSLGPGRRRDDLGTDRFGQGLAGCLGAVGRLSGETLEHLLVDDGRDPIGGGPGEERSVGADAVVVHPQDGLLARRDPGLGRRPAR